MLRLRLAILALLSLAWLISCASGATIRVRKPLLQRRAACADGSCSKPVQAAQAAPFQKPSNPTIDELIGRRRPFHPGPAQPMTGAIAGSIGGSTSPDGKSQVACDLPVSQRKRNTGGMGPRGPGSGAGLCVFTSIMHAARWQNEPRLFEFQKAMMNEPGGGYPEKVDAMIAKYGPGTRYIQYQGSDAAILEAAIKSGRMPGVTYNGHDPHYGDRSIAHMVSLVGFDRENNLACVLDNNYVGERELVWLKIDDFLARWKGGRSGWAVVLLTPPPPPPPTNQF